MPNPNETKSSLKGLLDLTERRTNPIKDKPRKVHCQKCGKRIEPVKVGNRLDGWVFTYNCNCK